MDYRMFDRDYIVRLERGEELVTSLKGLCREADIRLGEISGIGATNDCELGVYDVKEQKYYKNSFQGAYEITALAGNITRMDDDEPYLHLHATLGDREGQAFAGHLNRAVISATAELIIRTIPGEVDRFKDDDTGLNLLKLDD